MINILRRPIGALLFSAVLTLSSCSAEKTSAATAGSDMSAEVSFETVKDVCTHFATEEHVPQIPIWQMSDHDTAIRISGTIHALPPCVNVQSQLVGNLLRDADILVYESDVFSAQGKQASRHKMINSGTLLDGRQLADFFSTDERDLIDRWLGQFDSNLERSKYMRPWLVALVAQNSKERAALEAGDTMIAEQRDFAPSNFSADGSHIQESPNVLFLSSPGESFEAMASVDDEKFAAWMLEEAERFAEAAHKRTDPADVRTSNSGATLLYAWLSGDVEHLSQMVAESVSQSDFELLYGKQHFYRQNEEWSGQILDLLESEKGEILVFVGVAHLVGPQSVLDNLQQKGAALQRIQ